MKHTLVVLCCILLSWTAYSADIEPDRHEGIPLNPPESKKLLVLLDEIKQKDMFSSYFGHLTANGYQLSIFEAGEAGLSLAEFGNYLYDAIMLLCPKAEEFGGELTVDSLIDFVDAGRSLIIAGDSEVSTTVRDLASEVGVDFDEDGNVVMIEGSSSDNAISAVVNPLLNIPVVFPKKVVAPVAYKGIGLFVEDNDRMNTFLVAPANVHAGKPSSTKAKATAVGKDVSLLTVNHARNNARVMVSGSMAMFSDEFFKMSEYENSNMLTQLTRWVLRERGHLRVADVTHHLVGHTEEPQGYKIKDDVEYLITIQEYKDGKWVPFETNDLMLEFVMLDPYYRLPLKLVDRKTGRYGVTFKLPDKFGVFQFIVKSRRTGYNMLEAYTTVPVRPFHHDEYERFIPSAYPYYFGAFSVIAAFVVFTTVFVFHKPKVVKKDN